MVDKLKVVAQTAVIAKGLMVGVPHVAESQGSSDSTATTAAQKANTPKVDAAANSKTELVLSEHIPAPSSKISHPDRSMALLHECWRWHCSATKGQLSLQP